MPDHDATQAYYEKPFKGRRLLGIGAAVWLGFFLLGFVFQDSLQVENPIAKISHAAVFLISYIIYLIGYWQAVQAKGYPRILFLAGFAHIFGLIILLFLAQQEPQNTSNP